MLSSHICKSKIKTFNLHNLKLWTFLSARDSTVNFPQVPHNEDIMDIVHNSDLPSHVNYWKQVE